PYYNNEEKKRHDVFPGITGWTQVNGRNSIDWGKKLAYDVYYAKHVSFYLDVKIIWMTLLHLIKRNGNAASMTIKFSEYAARR
ncbi:MAG: sugar transferase, partial [Bacteroidota bacterium]